MTCPVVRQVHYGLEGSLLFNVVVGDYPLRRLDGAHAPRGEVEEEGGGRLEGETHALGGKGQKKVDAREGRGGGGAEQKEKGGWGNG